MCGPYAFRDLPGAPIRLKFLLLVFLLAIPVSANQNLEIDQFGIYSHAVWRASHHLNPGIPQAEVLDFCWSTWEGCGHDEGMMEVYTAICIQETSLNFIDNDFGAGYCGGYWPLIRRLLREHGVIAYPEAWVMHHPQVLNKWLAQRFCHMVKSSSIEEAVKTWRIGCHWRTNGEKREIADDYLEEVGNKLEWFKGKFKEGEIQ